MTNRSAAEAEASNVAKTGEELGRQYSLLWQEMAYVYREWLEYVELFGTSEELVEMLNRSASSFFSTVQWALMKDVFLRICRVTDPAITGRNAARSNLTVQNLPTLVDVSLRASLDGLIDQALQKSQFCREWRNRHIAHHDLALALDKPSAALEPASRLKVKEALDSIVAILNVVAGHHLDTELKFDFPASIGGAKSLLHVLEDGLKLRDDREKRLLRGAFAPDGDAHEIYKVISD